MKAVPVLLAASLLANVLFAAVVLRRSSVESGLHPHSAQENFATHVEPRAPESARGARMASATVSGQGADRDADFAGAEKLLREARFSAEAVREMLQELIGEHYDRRRRALGLGGPAPHEFWRSPVTFAGSGTPEQRAAQRALEEEMRGIMRSLFGRDYDVSDDTRDRRAHGLAPATAEKLHAIFADYREIEERARHDATSTSDVGAKLALIEKERRADIERLLTREELAEFDLRMGAGNQVHNILGQFSVTEAEFRALAAAHKAFSQANPGMTIRDRPRFMPEIRRVLGEERYAEFEASSQQNDQQARNLADMRTFTTSLNLPLGTAARVVAVQAEFQPMIRVVAGNPNLTSEQRAARLAQLDAEAREKLSGILGGAAGVDAYAKAKGAWLPASGTVPANAASSP